MAESTEKEPAPCYVIEDPVKNRHFMYATDLIYHFSSQFKTGWVPMGYTEGYYSNVLSPFSPTIAKALNASNRERELKVKNTFDGLVAASRDNVTYKFTDYATSLANNIFVKHASPEEFFEVLAYTARLSVYFHQQGNGEIPHLAVKIIEKALVRYCKDRGPGMYLDFSTAADKILSQKK